ncbi:MAG TPA: nucleotidyltransferase family protein [Pirellulaceae bacterium]
MRASEYMGVILAAGKGSRMAPFGEQFPKPMLPICNKPLVQHHVELMKSAGIEEIMVLVGHKGFEISKILGDGSSLGVRIRYVEQTNCLGIAHAVGCLERYVQRPFLLLLGDIFFQDARLEPMFAMFERHPGGAVLGVKEEPNHELLRRNFSVDLEANGRVSRVVEKPRSTTTSVKGIGLYLFDLTVFDAIRATPRTAMRDEYEITHSIQLMIRDGLPVHADFVVEDDVNLTYPADLLRCNLEQARRGSPDVVGEQNSIHPQARIVDSVLGSRIHVSHPIRITRTLIFSGTQVTSTTDLDAHILTPEGMVDCGGDASLGPADRQ